MSIPIIRKRERITTEQRRFSVEDEQGSGYGFDCDADGTVHFARDVYDEIGMDSHALDWRTDQPMPDWAKSDAGVQNFANVVFGAYGIWANVRYYTERNSYTSPAIGKCSCGEEVALEGDYGHGIDCECGRIYNQSGQELAPRSQWEDRYDEDSTEPYCVEFGYAGEDY